MRVLGDNLFAMDEAPARESEDDDDGPSITALSAIVDEAAEALDGIRAHLKRGAADSEGRFSFDAVKRRVADVRDCLDELAGHLGGSAGGGEDEGPGESDRDAACARARDEQRVDHRKDFKSGSADSARGLALDRRRGADFDLDAIFKPAQAQGEGADARDLREIFAPVGNSA